MLTERYLVRRKDRLSQDDIEPVKPSVDWITILRSQQADFIERLKSGHLLHCEMEGQHSELTVVRGERLKQLRDFCWQMTNKYKRTSNVRDVFINNLKGKLAEEAVKSRLTYLVTEVDYEKRLGGDGKVDFRLASDSSIGIQVKARHGSIDSVQWWIDQREITKNDLLACVLIQEEVHDTQTEHNLILAGFLPTTEITRFTNGRFSVGIDELLYSGGLRSYLESLQVKISQTQRFQELKTEQIWEDILKHLESPVSQQFFKLHGQLLSFDGQVAVIGIDSLPLLRLALCQNKFNIETAFASVFNSKIKIMMQHKEVKLPHIDFAI